MTIADMLSMPTLHAAKSPGRYLLRAVNPVTGQTHDGRYLTMKAALTKVAELLPDECSIEIWSSASLESRARSLPSVKRRGRAGARAADMREMAHADRGRSHGGY
jgi:hypothetical protein